MVAPQSRIGGAGALGRAPVGRDVLWSFRAAPLAKRVCAKCLARRTSLGRAEGSSTAEATNADKSQSESSRKGGRVHSFCSSMEADAGRRVGRRRFVAYVTRFLRKPSRLAPSVLSVERTTKVFFLFPQKYVYPRNITRTICVQVQKTEPGKDYTNPPGHRENHAQTQVLHH